MGKAGIEPLTPEEVRLYEKMRAKGLEPLTPEEAASAPVRYRMKPNTEPRVDTSFEVPQDSSPLDAIAPELGGAAEGVTQRHMGEIGGAIDAVAGIVDEPKPVVSQGGEQSGEMSDPSFLERYRTGRDDMQKSLDIQRELHPVRFGGAEVVGDALFTSGAAALTGGASLTPMGQAAQGMLSGEGASRGDLTKGEVGEVVDDSLLGGGLSATLGGAGRWVGTKLEPAADWAKGKVKIAIDRAKAMGAERSAKDTASARGVAGGETVHGMNIVKTASVLEPPPTTLSGGPALPSREPGAYADYLERSAALAEEKAAGAVQKQLAAPPSALGSPVDEVSSKARAAVEARRGAVELQNWLTAARRLRAMAAEVRRTGIVPEGSGDLQRQLLQSPEYAELSENVLEHMASDLPAQAARSRAAREMYAATRAAEPQRAAQYAEELLDPKAFLKGPVMDRVKRYGPPIVMGMSGGAVGGAVAHELGGGIPGLIGGMVVGQAAGALGGAGMRPAFRSFAKLLSAPIVQKTFFGTLEGTLRGAPDALGKYGGLMARELQANGIAGAQALDQALMGDPEYVQAKARMLGIQEPQP